MQIARVGLDRPVWRLRHRRQVMGDPIRYAGLDVHKEEIIVPVAESGSRRVVREYGGIPNTSTTLDGVARKFGRDGVRSQS
jgi:hypothetical protein